VTEPEPENTSGEAYARRLQSKQQVWWKKALNVQAPYRWNLRRQRLGRTLDVGCGIGRNLETLDPGSVGVDHNEHSVAVAREAGVTALTVTEWEQSPLRVPDSFDGILLAHVIEHMTEADGLALLREYLPYLRPGGRVFFVCPQERGYASDATHVRFTTGEYPRAALPTRHADFRRAGGAGLAAVESGRLQWNEHPMLTPEVPTCP